MCCTTHRKPNELLVELDTFTHAQCGNFAGCKTSTHSGWETSHIGQNFFKPLSLLRGQGKGAGAFPSCPQVRARYDPGQACSSQAPIWAFITLLKGTLSLLRRCPGTFPLLPAHLPTFFRDRDLKWEQLLSPAPDWLSAPKNMYYLK